MESHHHGKTVSNLYLIQQNSVATEVCDMRSENDAVAAARTEHHLLHGGHGKGGAAFGAYHSLGPGDLLYRRLLGEKIGRGTQPGRQGMRRRRIRVPGPSVRRSFRRWHRRAHPRRLGQYSLAERAGAKTRLQDTATVWTAFMPGIRGWYQWKFLLSE